MIVYSKEEKKMISFKVVQNSISENFEKEVQELLLQDYVLMDTPTFTVTTGQKYIGKYAAFMIRED